MTSLLLLFFFLIAEVLALDYNNFLQETLDKIQKERLDNTGELSESDLSSEFNGEIILEAQDSDFDENADGIHDISFADNYNSMAPEETATYLPSPHNVHTPNEDGVKDGGVKGYYYYFYPLNHYLDKYKGMEPAKDSVEMSAMMDTMMKNTMMQKQENNVTPLFKAMTWFIGTAMVFIISILLMPKFKVKKAKEMIKSANWEIHEFAPPHFIMKKNIPERSIVNWKNK